MPSNPDIFREKYGLNAGDRLPDSNFLDEVLILLGKVPVIGFVLSEASKPILRIKDHYIGEDYYVVEVQQPSGGYSEGQVHATRIVEK